MNEYHINHKLRHDHEQAARNEQNARFLEVLRAGDENQTSLGCQEEKQNWWMKLGSARRNDE